MRDKIISQVIMSPQFVSTLSVWLLKRWWSKIHDKINSSTRHKIKTLVVHKILFQTLIGPGKFVG